MIKRVLGDRILVKPDSPEDKTASGIFLVQSSQAKKPQGRIVMKGTGKLMPDGTTVPIDLEIGMHIAYEAFAGQTVIVNDTEYLLLPAAAVTMELE